MKIKSIIELWLTIYVNKLWIKINTVKNQSAWIWQWMRTATMCKQNIIYRVQCNVKSGPLTWKFGSHNEIWILKLVLQLPGSRLTRCWPVRVCSTPRTVSACPERVGNIGSPLEVSASPGEFTFGRYLLTSLMPIQILLSASLA